MLSTESRRIRWITLHDIPCNIDPANTPGIPLDIKEKTAKRGKEGVRRALQLVQHSTASMGR